VVEKSSQINSTAKESRFPMVSDTVVNMALGKDGHHLGGSLPRSTTSKTDVRVTDHIRDVHCHPGVPCEYPDVVDFRIIVLTYKRNNSLLELLNSLNNLDMDGDVAALEIWIDRNKTNAVSTEVLECARNFRWNKGRVRVHVQEKQVGVYGQWIDTWRPKLGQPPSRNNVNGAGELVLILEDDMSVSKYAYRWLKAAHRFYANRTDIAGITLQSEGVIIAKNGGDLRPPSDGVAYLYRYSSSWGFAPRGRTWYDFQDWFHKVSTNAKFRPYVKGIISTQWYNNFIKAHTETSMWTMWFIHYCHQYKLYTLYNNIKRLTKNNKTCCLAINRREPGLHYKGRGPKKNARDREMCLTCSWKDDFLRFSQNVSMLEYSGQVRQKI